MINEFLGPRLDFILFIHGLSLFFTAAFTLNLARSGRSLRWLWLGLFATAMAAALVCYLLSQASLEGELLKNLSWSLHALAYFFLGLFGLHSLPLGRTRSAGFAVSGAMLVLPAACAAAFGLPGFLLAVRLGLGPAAGVLALAAILGPAGREAGQHLVSLLRPLLGAYVFSATVLPGLHLLARALLQGPAALEENLPPVFYAVLLALAGVCLAAAFARSAAPDAEASEPGSRRGLHAYAIGLFAVGFAIFMGFTATDTLGERSEGAMRSELFMRVAAVGNAIDPALAAQLRADPADLDTEPYRRLLLQLTKIRLSNPDLRFVYLCALRLPQREVLFSLDTEPPTSLDYSPPGQAYPEAPPELAAIFSSGKAALVGPYSDRWGQWVSGFSPIKDEMGAIAGVVGMDISAKAVNAMKASSRLVGIVITFLLAVIGAGLGLIIQRNKDLAAANALLEEEIGVRKQAEEELRQSEQRYRELSITDDLTGLFNARRLYSQAQAELERATRYGRSLSLLLLDVDDFKAFNDTHGHQEGDRYLALLGNILKECVRDSDAAFRYGGEEFVALLPETGKAEATHLAERLRQRVEDRSLQLPGGTQARRTVSVGLALYRAGESLADFIRRADEAMYRAKQQGKNRVCLED